MLPQTKVFVGSLPVGSKPEELRRLFERYGVVTECDVMNRCGFVHMQTEDMAANAIRALNGTSFNGGIITVERGRIKERSRGGAGGRGAPGRRGGPNGGPMRGPGMGMGGNRDRVPYSRPPSDSNRILTGPGAIQTGGGPPPRANGGYDRRPAPTYEDRMPSNGFSGYAAPYQDDRRQQSSYGPPMDDRRSNSFGDDRGAPLPDRRGGLRPPPPHSQGGLGGGFDRNMPSNNGDMFSRRSPPQMRSGGGSIGYGDRDPYNQQFPPLGRVGGSGPRGGRDMGMGPRRY